MRSEIIFDTVCTSHKMLTAFHGKTQTECRANLDRC